MCLQAWFKVIQYAIMIGTLSVVARTSRCGSHYHTHCTPWLLDIKNDLSIKHKIMCLYELLSAVFLLFSHLLNTSLYWNPSSKSLTSGLTGGCWTANQADMIIITARWARACVLGSLSKSAGKKKIYKPWKSQQYQYFFLKHIQIYSFTASNMSRR